MASDFVLGRFHFLKRLLLLHGFWNYDRIARMIVYFFYKNAVSLMSHQLSKFCYMCALLCQKYVSHDLIWKFLCQSYSTDADVKK